MFSFLEAIGGHSLEIDKFAFHVDIVAPENLKPSFNNKDCLLWLAFWASSDLFKGLQLYLFYITLFAGVHCDHCLCALGELQLGQDVTDMRSHRFISHHQGLCNLVIGAPKSKLTQNFLFTFCEFGAVLATML